MDLTQILVAVTLSVTSLFMILIGYQVIKILQEVRTMLKKVEAIVEGFERVGSGVENGFNDMMGFVGGLKSVFKILEIFRQRQSSRSSDQNDSTTP